MQVAHDGFVDGQTAASRIHLIGIDSPLLEPQETALSRLASDRTVSELRVIAAGDLPSGDLRYVAYDRNGSHTSGTIHPDGSIAR